MNSCAPWAGRWSGDGERARRRSPEHVVGFRRHGVLESVTDLCTSLHSGNWVASSLAGVGAALDVAAAVVDPLGSLIAAGLGWLMEHLEPLKGWLNDLTGDAGAVLGFASTWENVAGAMGAAGDELNRVVRADLESMSGESITAYAAYADGLAEQIRATGASASAIGSALTKCAMVVQVVHDLVRDALSQLVGSAISWAAEAIFTVGLATPIIIGQVTARVSSLATRVGKHVTDVITTAKSLKNLLEALKDALGGLATGLRRGLPGARAGTPGAPRVSAPAPAPDYGVAFFGPSNLRYYTAPNATLGSASSPFFHMPLVDAGEVRTAEDALRATGRSPSLEREVIRGGRPGDPEVYGLSFPRNNLSPQVATAADANGWAHYLEGGHTAVRMDDAPGRPGTGASSSTARASSWCTAHRRSRLGACCSA